MTKMFGELAEEVAIDLRAGFGSVHRQSKLVGGHERSGKNRSQKNQTNQESAHGKGRVLCLELKVNHSSKNKISNAEKYSLSFANPRA